MQQSGAIHLHRGVVMRLLFTMIMFAAPMLADAATWSLKTTKDRLTDRPIVTYTAMSDNAFNFAFPYRGATRAQLAIRSKGNDDIDVVFLIERGQLMHDIRDGEIRVRFDDGEVEVFSTSPSTSRDSHITFLGGEPRFVERAIKAKRIRVEFAAFSNGTHVADFRFGKSLPAINSNAKPGTSPKSGAAVLEARAGRLSAREDECRKTKEFVECLERARACYQKVTSIEDEAACQDEVEQFAR